jgi:hypothetical protein
MTPPDAFPEAGLSGTTLRDLGLQIAGTRLEPILAEFAGELERVGLGSLKPEFYLATEWGVPFPSLSVAIPFYLARPDLVRLHGDRTGLVEGNGRADILRYLRHEVGHVVNYAYRLYERPGWTAAFGPFDAPYPEEYSPRPFSRAHVTHLPGWYAQKHPDEDWAETFAVWMTPGRSWQQEYADRPAALAKLLLCDTLVREVAGTPPLPFPAEEPTDGDEEWDEFAVSLGDYYGQDTELDTLPGLDDHLRLAFHDAAPDPDLDGDGVPDQLPVRELVRRLTRELTTNVFRWTGHFPERTLPLLRLIARRADALGQVYDRRHEAAAVVALTALVTAMAMADTGS